MLLFENHPALAVLADGAERAGLYYTPISIQLKTREVARGAFAQQRGAWLPQCAPRFTAFD